VGGPPHPEFGVLIIENPSFASLNICITCPKSERRGQPRQCLGLSEGPPRLLWTQASLHGLQTRFSADAERYGIDLATAPIEKLITEFVPSIASHIHTHVVFVQRLINRVAVNPP
jgi:hypothetical protein